MPGTNLVAQDNKRGLYQTDFPAGEFAARWQKLFDKIGGDACALVQGAGPARRSEPFRQTNEFYYLCGVEVQQCYLLLDGRNRTSTLFVPHRDERRERSEGPGLAAEDASELKALTGVNEVCGPEELDKRLRGISTLYTPHSPAEGRAQYRDDVISSEKCIAADPWAARPGREQRFIYLLQARYPGIVVRDLSPHLDSLRIIKSPREIAVLRRAGQLTALAATEAMRCTRPGIYEFQLGAAAQYIYQVNGSMAESYRAIIGAGANAWYAHYHRNNAALAATDLVLFDYAPDYHYYTSDIGRMWPVNGKYNAWQRELYGFMTRYLKAILKHIRPGVLPAQILEEAAMEMKPILEATQFSKPAFEKAARDTLTFKGHLSHPVGMAVHDVGQYFERPLEPGLVISLDPQMWVPGEKLYVRVEDTVAVTATGVEVLTAAAPLELDQIETTVGTGGMLQRFPPTP
jgi:Xaa-Pro aminopeptidase